MSTCASFYRLTYAEQADLLLKKGTFIQTRRESNFIIDLYEVQDLLIEIFYHKETEEPVSVMAYNTNEKLKTLQKGNLSPRLRAKSNTNFSGTNFAA